MPEPAPKVKGKAPAKGKAKAVPKVEAAPAAPAKGKGKGKPAPVAPVAAPSKKPRGLDPAFVIVMKIKQNPRRPNTGRHERMAVLMKHNGKTIKEFTAAGGNISTLQIAIQEGIAEIKEK
jgi:hypothetical protein